MMNKKTHALLRYNFMTVLLFTTVSTVSTVMAAEFDHPIPKDEIVVLPPGSKKTAQALSFQGRPRVASETYRVDDLTIDPWLFPLPEREYYTVSRPPGQEPYGDRSNNKKMRDDVFAIIWRPVDWHPNDKRPVTVWAFGSGWKGRGGPNAGSGQKEAEHLCRAGGMVVVSLDYRKGLETGIADATSAIRWTRKNAAMLGIDPDRVTGGGASSGGHITLSSTVLKEGPENPWDDPGIPKHCQYHYGQVAVSSRPQTPEYSPAHNLRDGLPPYLQIAGGVDNWARYALDFHHRAQATDLPLWYVTYDNRGHMMPGWGMALHHAHQTVTDFLHCYGAMDTIHRGLVGAQIDLATMDALFTNQGLKPGFTLAVDSGGRIEGTTFIDDGEPGLSVITATSTDNPLIKRHAYVSIGARVWAGNATTSGSWESYDYLGHPVQKTTEDGASIAYTHSLPPGEWMAYAVLGGSEWMQQDIDVSIQGANFDAKSTVNFSKVLKHSHYPLGSFQLANPEKVSVVLTRTPSGTGKQRPISSWGVVFLPRYRGGENGLRYKRGYKRDVFVRDAK